MAVTITSSGFGERRTAPRKQGADCRWLVGTRVWPGRDVRLVDISPWGALVEGATRLLPGAAIDLQLTGRESRHVVRGRVLRCTVAALSRSTGVCYRAALRFDHAFVEPGSCASMAQQAGGFGVAGSL